MRVKIRTKSLSKKYFLRSHHYISCLVLTSRLDAWAHGKKEVNIHTTHLVSLLKATKPQHFSSLLPKNSSHFNLKLKKSLTSLSWWFYAYAEDVSCSHFLFEGLVDFLWSFPVLFYSALSSQNSFSQLLSCPKKI